MDEEVTDKLRAWGLEACIPAFKEHLIDAEAFELLDAPSIHKILPHIGWRLKFTKKFEDQKKVDEILKNVSFNTSGIDIEESALSASKQMHCENQITYGGKENNETEPRQKQLVTKAVDKGSIFPNGLKALLEEDTNGQIVLKHRGKFVESDRRKLTKIVVDYLFRHHRFNKKITVDTFERACDEVVAEFPTEQRAIYFVPYKPKTAGAPRTLSCGKLWSKYINYNRNLSETLEKKNEDDFTPLDVDSEKEALTLFEFLKSNLDPPEKITDAWNKTFRLRQAYRLEHTIQEYFTDIPVLKTQQGFCLLTSDFEHLHAAHVNALYEYWKTFSKVILKIATENNLLSSTDNVEPKDSVIIDLLPQLFAATSGPRRKSTKGGKTSKEEARKSFFLLVENTGNIDEEIEKKRTKLLRVGETMQPFIVAAGPIKKLTNIFVVVDGTKYKMTSALQALDVCFKVFFALNSAYPFDCQHIWTFIQHYVYKIVTPTDKKFTAVASLTADFLVTEKQLMQENEGPQILNEDDNGFDESQGDYAKNNKETDEEP